MQPFLFSSVSYQPVTHCILILATYSHNQGTIKIGRAKLLASTGYVEGTKVTIEFTFD